MFNLNRTLSYHDQQSLSGVYLAVTHSMDNTLSPGYNKQLISL